MGCSCRHPDKTGGGGVPYPDTGMFARLLRTGVRAQLRPLRIPSASISFNAARTITSSANLAFARRRSVQRGSNSIPEWRGRSRLDEQESVNQNASRNGSDEKSSESAGNNGSNGPNSGNRSSSNNSSNNSSNRSNNSNTNGPNGPNNNRNGPNGPNGPKGDPQFIKIYISPTKLFWVFVCTTILYSALSGGTPPPELAFSEFVDQILKKGEVSKLEVVNREFARVYTRGNSEQTSAVFTIGSVDSFEARMNEVQDQLGVAVQDRVPIVYTETGGFLSGVLSLAPTLLFLGFLYFIARSAASKSNGPLSNIFGIGKSKAHLYNPQTDSKVKFSEVAGMDEAKREIMEFVSFLREPEKFEKLGAKIPRGAILSGAPGTGKTMLAKATAGEAGVPFFSVSGSEFVEMFSGVGASRVRDLFKRAKETAPSMIWIDEIDAIGKARTGAGVKGGNDERESTLNQLLVEMDGFESNQRVIVLAGTNRADMLDKALLRPGRFDRHISIDLPSMDGRRQIYDVYLNKIKSDTSVPEFSGKLAAMTPGFSGADIANCCNEAALAAARDNADKVTLKHFEIAIDRVVAGLERKSRCLPTDKRKIVAYHEAGHAVAGWFLRYADPLVKVTIVPHGSAALGYAQLLPNDDTVVTMARMQHLMTVALGGRTSEELFFPSVSAGASDDFKRVTRIAKSMVCDYGYSRSIGAVRLERVQGAVQKPFSEETDAKVDKEVKKIIDAAHEACSALLTEHRDAVIKVAEALLEREQLTRRDLVALLGERPDRDNENEAFKKYLDVR